ncbi:imidazolonepropionase [Povalibacter sp.]|uniref:imidazolonepropionase n=1 Tax=Povalibacter sp. TaxID=1962978 RepID=UPI002F3E2C22
MTAPAERQTWDRLWIGADLATMDGTNDSIGPIADGALAVRDGRIAWLGTRDELQQLQWSATKVTQADGLWITPGLIECHTHLIYAGDRAHEFETRLRGATYEEIARAGGGILSTMRTTRAASADQLLACSLARAAAFVREGVTTLEIKSGYGLDVDSELKMLRVGRLLGERLGIPVVNTFLGAHALPPEYSGRQEDYVRLVIEEMLPAVAESGLADAVDAYHERIAFTREQIERIFQRAGQLPLPLRLHADQLSDCGGGMLAAAHGAMSADHLEYSSMESIERMAAAGVVAGLLPGAFYFLRQKQLPPIERMRSLGMAMAVSSDCNPGTSPMASLLIAMNMACVVFRMTPTEVLQGVTRHAARALGLAHDRGILRVGMRADLAIWRLRHPQQLCAEIGGHRPVEVLVAGEGVRPS